VRAQLTENLLKYGVLKCRDLVELYFGWRYVVTISENAFTPSMTPYLILNQDPRRIRYEIWINVVNVVAGATVLLGSPAAIDAGTAPNLQPFSFYNGPLVRDWITDGEAVTLPVMVSDGTGVIIFSTRETFLTPAPVDELPLG